ncbi:hypothetical protein [Paenibacillus sp. y28]|uniref:hypothetical protein n=1 Tax=Paenibacillus sp. y28 TaxID=3129110 RepID=UPI00301AFBCB
MERSESFMRILEATANIQMNVALILEAKAYEAEKTKQWICNHLVPHVFSEHTDQLKQSITIHEQLIEVVDSLTKMEQGLGKNLSILLGENESSGGGFGGGDMFDLGDGEA